MRQEARSYVPGLTVQPFWSPQPWAAHLEAHYDTIRGEFDRTLTSKALKRGENVWAKALDGAESYGPGWTTLVLMDRGRWSRNAALFPETARILEEVPCVEAFFAAMQPKSAIKPHSDSTNFVLTSHLGLRIPQGCRLSVGDQTRHWQEGQTLLFDTSIMHDAANDADQTRYILMMRVWHPDLTLDERNGLQFLFDCLELPNLVSEDPKEVILADQQLAFERASLDTVLQRHSQPPPPTKKNKRKTASPRGFG